MAAAIGGTGMDAVGQRLAGAPPAAGGNGAPPGQSPAPNSVDMSAMAGAPGMDAQRQMLEQTMGTIRQLGEGVKALAQIVPMAADELQQIQQLLKQVVIKAAAPTPTATGSGMAVPGNGGGMA